jgi:hypothetical protein
MEVSGRPEVDLSRIGRYGSLAIAFVKCKKTPRDAGVGMPGLKQYLSGWMFSPHKAESNQTEPHER